MTPHGSTRLAAAAAACLAAGLLAVIPGCASRPSPGDAFTPATPDSLAPLNKVELRLTRFVSDGQEVTLSGNLPITLSFDEGGKVSGRSAVNRYFGGFKLGPDGAIEWPKAGLGMTRMAGPAPAMELESRFGRSLTATTRLLASPEGARFQSAQARDLLEFTR